MKSFSFMSYQVMISLNRLFQWKVKVSIESNMNILAIFLTKIQVT